MLKDSIVFQQKYLFLQRISTLSDYSLLKVFIISALTEPGEG